MYSGAAVMGADTPGGDFPAKGATSFPVLAVLAVGRSWVNEQENRVRSKDPLSSVLFLCNYGAKGFQDKGF